MTRAGFVAFRPHIHGFAELITKAGREARKKNKIKARFFSALQISYIYIS